MFWAEIVLYGAVLFAATVLGVALAVVWLYCLLWLDDRYRAWRERTGRRP